MNAGGKIPLVLLHGWASHPQVFRGLARALEKTHRVHLMALPGYGDAPACAPYTLECMADTLAAGPASFLELMIAAGSRDGLRRGRGAIGSDQDLFHRALLQK